MDSTTALLALATFLCWGTETFVAKLAANRIGDHTLFWHQIALAVPVIVYSLRVYDWGRLVQGDRAGIGLAMVAGLLASAGYIAFFSLLTRTEASLAVPLTALYPACAAVLAIVFLRESITPHKVLGVLLSLLAIYLLSRQWPPLSERGGWLRHRVASGRGSF